MFKIDVLMECLNYQSTLKRAVFSFMLLRTFLMLVIPFLLIGHHEASKMIHREWNLSP